MAEPKKKKIVDADSGKEVKAGSRKKKPHLLETLPDSVLEQLRCG